MRFSSEDIQSFARWSGDHNPLHVSEEFARQTHFGEPIVHGMLTVLEALRATRADAATGAALTELEIEFRSAVIVGQSYETSATQDGQDFVATLHGAGQVVLSVRGEMADQLGGATAIDLSWLPSAQARTVREQAAAPTLADLRRGVQITGTYAMRPPIDRPIAGVTPTQARVLGLCSYITGMEVPGLRSLFTRVTIRFFAEAAGEPDLCYRARTIRFDRQFRVLQTELQVATRAGRVVATGVLRSYVPFSPAAVPVEALERRLAGDNGRLSGQVALVVGGSRGLGADLACALALAGCHVYVSSRRDDTARQDLHRMLRERGASVEFLQGDAGDPAWCRSALAAIRARHARIDILALNACAPPPMVRFGADSAARHAEYVRDNLRLVEAPLAAFADALSDSDGTIVFISSSFVEEPPAGFGHYVAVKQAAEGLVRTVCRELPHASGLIARPPVLQTRWNDTPAGVVGSIPSDWAASHIVNALRSDRPRRGVTVLSEFPSFEVDEGRTIGGDARSDFAIRLAATFTVDTLREPLAVWVKSLELNAAVDVAPYGQVLQSLLDPGSVLNAKGRGFNAVLIRLRDWLRELAPEQAGNIDFVRLHIEAMARDLERSLRSHRAHAGADTLVLISPSYGSRSSAESILIRQTESELLAALKDVPGLEVVRAADFHAAYDVNEDAAADPLRDEIGHIPYRDEYLHTLATIVARHVHARVSPARKVVVVDCDNTLWGGVVGEVGPEGLTIHEGHAALHRTLTALVQRGVLVCLCSKNQEADVWQVFETRADFSLRREDIVAAAVNWLPKSQNLRTLAARLNLGLESFVFIDDNPVECAEVRSGCPEVLTIEWPQSASDGVRLLHHVWEFDARRATAEDARRTQLYREEFRRQQLRADTLTFDDFIGSLQLAVDINPLSPADLRRAAQLTLRTNQFNFTTIRREEADVQALASGGRHDIRTVHVRDRFGDYGLVGLVIVERRDGVWNLDTFLLSCRVLGRGVEHRIAAALGETAAAAGARAVKLRVDSTARNTPARAFLESIAPAELLLRTERGLECELPVDVLASVRFEPSSATDAAVADDTEPKESSAAGAIDVERLRRREQQIVRAAFELNTGASLKATIDAAPSPPAIRGSSSLTAIDATTVASVVYGAFATALRTTTERVRELDTLEALGCDSLRIVEITVALSEKFPSLPGTLLFEHRSVRAIVNEITALSSRHASGAGASGADAARHSSGLADGRSARPVRRDEPQRAEIAVVGMHLRCAGANSPEELWDLLSRGGVAVRPVPADRPHFLHPLSDTRPHWAGLLDDPARFDAELFGVSPREAEFMDPQLRLFLEVAWGALEDAGCLGADHEPNTGVFAGVMYGDYGSRANVRPASNNNAYRCWEGFSLANRLSQLLGFGGPSLAVDTACSSSGTALHLACAAVRAGECQVAVVGGVNLILDPDRFASLGRLGILSERGVCEPFGADADGTVLGEGAGVVVLRPLGDAIRRGDRIYGVIKGTGVSTGNGSIGFTAPNPQAQAEAIRRSVIAAGIDPRTVSYVETHGTGTALGDPIEVRGLTLGYGAADLHDAAADVRLRCRIGSIKPNIGHLEAGAGVLGLIKVLLQLQHGMLLPSVTSRLPNPQIAFAGNTFEVQRQLEPWEQTRSTIDGISIAVPRRAGLSSFGVGGANAHVLVEETPAPVTRANSERPAHLLALSARNTRGLERQVTELRRHLGAHEDISLANLCFSINTGRRHFEHRVALPVTTREQLLKALDAIEGSASTSKPKIAFLFTGQGSQYAGMGRQLYEAQPVFRAALDRCATLFDRMLERPLLELIFAADSTPEAGLIHQTGYTQPALFAFEYALSELWRSWGVTPDIVMGHSVGEIAAMCVAGGVSLEDGLRLIEARGRLMQALPVGGTMTSVMADERRVIDALTGSEELVAIAAINAPGQVVISGAGAAVADVAARLTADGIKTKALTVSHAFHSPLMKPMLAEYERVVRTIRFSPPRVPLVSCVDGVLADDALTEPAYWLRQVMDPVRFVAGMETLTKQQVTAYVEIGPHPVLLGMARQCVADDTASAWLPSLQKDRDAWHTLLGSLATLYMRGADVDWRGFDRPYGRSRIQTPAYAFGGKQYWLKRSTAVVEVPADRPDAESGLGGASSDREPGAYEVVWRSQAAGSESGDGTRRWVIFADRTGIGSDLARELAASGSHVTTVVPGARFAAVDNGYVLDPERRGDFESLWNAIARDGIAAPLGIAHLWSLDAPAFHDGDEFSRTLSLSITSATYVLQTLAARARDFADARLPDGSEGPVQPAIWAITRGAVILDGVGSDEPVAVGQSLLWGFGRTATLEHPELWRGTIDIDNAPSSVARLAEEMRRPSREDQVALRGERRCVARLVRREPSSAGAPVLSAYGTYLVTGGLGALGLHAAEWLVERGARHVVLASRRGAAEGPAAVRIGSLEQRGARMTVVAADVSEPEASDALLSTIANSGAPLRGVLHAAGVDGVVPIERLTAEEIGRVGRAKALGGWMLHERTRDLDLDFFICFSSVSAMLGSQGRAHYAAANAFIDALAAERRRLGLRATSVNWGPWNGGGMASSADLADYSRIGNRGLSPQQALRALDRLVVAGASQAGVMDIDWTAFAPVYQSRRAKPLLDEILAGTATEHESAAAAPVAEWVARLSAIPPSERRAELETLLRREVADTLGFDDATSVPADRNLYDIGMDSLMMADLVSRLKKRLGSSHTALVFQHPIVASLAGPLLDALTLGGAPPNRSPGTSAGGPPASKLPAPARTDRYSPEAEPEILAFQEEGWPKRNRSLIPARWRWMFVESARRLAVETRVWLHRENGRIVGYMGSIPIRLKIADEERSTGWLVDTMVLERYRNLAVGSRLMLEAHQDQPFSLSLGQTAEMRAILLRLGWKEVAPLQRAVRIVHAGRVLGGKLPTPVARAAGFGLDASAALRRLTRPQRRLQLRLLDRFDERHDALWARVSTALTCASVRDASYLNWKYVDQPGQDLMRVELSDGRDIVGVAVWMFREPDSGYSYSRALLVDLVAPLDDQAVLQNVVSAACDAAIQRGVDALVCMHIDARLTAALRSCGFRLREPERYLLVDPDTLPHAVLDRVLAAESWFITQGDSDIDRP